jgi:hypothetical protein
MTELAEGKTLTTLIILLCALEYIFYKNIMAKMVTIEENLFYSIYDRECRGTFFC